MRRGMGSNAHVRSRGIIGKHYIKTKALTRTVSCERTAERTATGFFHVLKAVLSGAAEDHLRAALMRPGNSRYRANEAAGIRGCA